MLTEFPNYVFTDYKQALKQALRLLLYSSFQTLFVVLFTRENNFKTMVSFVNQSSDVCFVFVIEYLFVCLCIKFGKITK